MAYRLPLHMKKTNLCGLTRDEFERLMEDVGEKPFRARQLYKWIYKNRVFAFRGMSDLRRDLRLRLQEKYYIGLPQIAARQKSSDGTEKFLLELEDKNVIESVLIEDESSGRTTLCISSQSGCPLGCTFCATGALGFNRNLTVGEIIGQPLVIRDLYGEGAFDNIVFMGMGEPLLNYAAVMTAIDIMTDSLGLMVGARKITISTAGVTSGIRKLTASGSKVNLALSLNAPDDARRRRIMPVTKKYPLAGVLEAVGRWTEVHKRRVTFEYILFAGFNDGEQDALALAALVRGIPCKINLLAYNPIEGGDGQRPGDVVVDRFAQTLYPRAPAVTIRKSRGRDIDAACGQLAGRKGYL
ncbi:MAG: 23S rRNA (adenine(2503)-C(2))-methyltransferase RlmN [candidate division Zixibacteria bacterium]|nr:23S rRNA (adenine(2503)-C(2))-methyltransferase RlmN [candidate division Zixibacteria bacterium]